MLRSWLPPTSHDEGKSATTAKKDRIRVILEDEKDPDGNMVDVSVVLRFVGVRSVPLRCLCLGRRSCRRLFFFFRVLGNDKCRPAVDFGILLRVISPHNTEQEGKKTRTKSKYPGSGK